MFTRERIRQAVARGMTVRKVTDSTLGDVESAIAAEIAKELRATSPGDTALTKSDVTVAPLSAPPCEYCESAAATHVVWIAYRAPGERRAFGQYCEPCAELKATILRGSLPEYPCGDCPHEAHPLDVCQVGDCLCDLIPF